MISESEEIIDVVLKEQFRKAAHSSIMKLNNDSMDKLYDLMLMGFKYQVLQTMFPTEIVQITLNHLDGLHILLEELSECHQGLKPDVYVKAVQRIQSVTEFFVQNIFTKTSCLEYMELKQRILLHLQDKNVKVSFFIQNNLQDKENGRLLVESNHYKILRGFRIAGTLTTFKDAQVSTQLNNFPINFQDFDERNFLNCSTRCSQLGQNMYVYGITKIPSSPISSPTKSANRISIPETPTKLVSKEINALSKMLREGIQFNQTDKVKIYIAKEHSDVEEVKLDFSKKDGSSNSVNLTNQSHKSYLQKLASDLDSQNTTREQNEQDDLLCEFFS